MSTQYSDTTPTYCSSCQTLNQYTGWETTVTECAASKQYVKSNLYNQMIQRLKNLHIFGDHDSVTRKPLNTDELNDKNLYDLIDEDMYNSIASRIFDTYTEQHTNDIIYGSYFDDLKTQVNNYKIPNTRYWICRSQHSYNCCDCYGQCCESQCSCHGECSCYGQGCSWDIGECYEGCGRFSPW